MSGRKFPAVGEPIACGRRFDLFGRGLDGDNPTPDTYEDRGDGYRACSFCGGMHPDDAIAFVKAGCEVEGTDKGYKRYLRGQGIGGPGKLYIQHFSKDQVAEFNNALRTRPLPRLFSIQASTAIDAAPAYQAGLKQSLQYKQDLLRNLRGVYPDVIFILLDTDGDDCDDQGVKLPRPADSCTVA